MTARRGQSPLEVIRVVIPRPGGPGLATALGGAGKAGRTGTGKPGPGQATFA